GPNQFGILDSVRCLDTLPQRDIGEDDAAVVDCIVRAIVVDSAGLDRGQLKGQGRGLGQCVGGQKKGDRQSCHILWTPGHGYGWVEFGDQSFDTALVASAFSFVWASLTGRP